ncbi:Uncharacterised protein [Roseomonas gilardii subsp. rosea]|nr:Uncharacterised protein [Roseomonas gilardii subsp. rosea]
MSLVKLTEADLRAAMRDPLYWGSHQPGQTGFRDWVTRGWRALAQAETRGGGTVHVQAYTRVRNGRSEQVSAYTQARSGAGRGVLMPIADKRPPNLPPQPPGGTRRGPSPDGIPSRTVPLGASPLTPILPDVGIKPVQSLPLGGSRLQPLSGGGAHTSAARPPVSQPTLREILVPGGQPIGTGDKNSGANIRGLPGGDNAAREMFRVLTEGREGVDVTPATYPSGGKLIQLPDGTKIGYRPSSRSGTPAIDITRNELSKIVTRIHFNE